MKERARVTDIGRGQPRFLICSLGCKVNQFDAASMSVALESVGLRRMGEGEFPSLIVVQTCTVTSATESQNRQLIRKLRADHPDAILVATGCQAEAFAESLQSMAEVDLVWGNSKKDALLDRMVEMLGVEPARRVGEGILWGEEVAGLPGRTRAFLKVQDGCNGSCSYCIVPRARGPSRSRPLDSILRALERMENVGIKEVVLTGIHLGAYGRDLEPPSSLCELVNRVLHGCSIPRIRLSSIEPQELEEGIIQQMAENPRLCPHLHVPLQSGQDEILELMNRPYNTAFYMDRIQKAAGMIPHLTLGMDIIVGFPGEMRKHFNESLRFIESLPWTYLHVFPFSPRPGTRAEGMKPVVPPEEIRERANLLRKLSRERIHARMASCIGSTTEVLLEGPCKGMKGWMGGRTDSYLRVAVRAGEQLRNRMVRARLDGLSEGMLVGTII